MSIIKVDDIQSTTAGAVGFSTLPAFHVYTSETITLTTSYAAVLAGKMGGTLLNQGSHFNNTTGKFTAPIAGTYWFSCAGLPYTTSSGDFFYFRKNGSHYGDGVGGGAAFKTYLINADESITNSLPITLAASDYVDTYFVANGTEANYSHFSGYLIG